MDLRFNAKKWGVICCGLLYFSVHKDWHVPDLFSCTRVVSVGVWLVSLEGEEPEAAVVGGDHPQQRPWSSHLLSFAQCISQTPASHPRQGAGGRSAVLAPIRHAGLVRDTKTTAEMVGVMRAQPETGLENFTAYQRAPLSLLPELPVSDKSLRSRETVRGSACQRAELYSMFQRADYL